MSRLEDYSLRPLIENDLSTVLEWRNSDRIRSNMYTNHVITIEEHHAWFRGTTDDDQSRYLIIEYRGKPVGLSYFTDMDRVNGTCLWGFYVGASDAPRGTGTVLGFLSMNFIFTQQQLRKACGEVLSFNEPSRRLFDRLGFVKEGCRRQHVIKNGLCTDVILFSLLADEWLNTGASSVRDLISNWQVQA